MAYLHCHNCHWSQDDFWDYRFSWKNWKKFLLLRWSSRPFGYNPISILLENIATYLKPRMIKMDSYWAKENGFKSNVVHSWNFVKGGFIRYFRVRRNMLYKNYEAYMRHRKIGIARCPNCNSRDHWDID